MDVALAQNLNLDKRRRRAPGRSRLVGIILPEIAAADGIGFGQAVTQRGLRAAKAFLQPGDVGGWPRCAAGGDVGHRAQVEFLAVRVVHQLEAHRRHPDEIGHFLCLDQPQRLARIPFGHQHHPASDNETGQQHRHFPGDVEQRNIDQGLGHIGRRRAARGQYPEQGDQMSRISIDCGGHRAMGRQRALGIPGRSRGEQYRRIVVRRDDRKHGRRILANQLRQRLARMAFDRDRDQFPRTRDVGNPRGARRVGQDQLGRGQVQRMAHLLALPPAVDQGRDRPGLERRHVGDDPARAVTHRDRYPVALDDPALDQPARDVARQSVKVGKAQPFFPRDDRVRRAVECAKGIEKARQRGREIACNRLAIGVTIDHHAPARPDHRGQRGVEFAVELAWHRFSFAFQPRHLMRRHRSGEEL